MKTKLFFRQLKNKVLCLFSHGNLLFVRRLSLSADLMVCSRCEAMLVKECDCGKIVKWGKVKDKYKSMSKLYKEIRLRGVGSCYYW